MQTVNSKVNLLPASDIIDALQNILHSHGIIGPDLETPYYRAILPNTHVPAIELNGERIGTIVAARQEQLDAVLRDISGLEAITDGIKNLHQQLVEQKDQITQSMTFHKGLVSSLCRLPTEVLSQNFHHCLPGDKYMSPVSKFSPMLLTRICRQWREIAVDMPSLWCMLYVTIDIGRVREEEYLDDDSYSDESDVEVDNGDWQRAAVFYNSWLKRSRGRPLSLVVERCHTAKLRRSLLQPYIDQISCLSIRFS
ncbi:hypothetical protein DEU56DRAFT_855412 [Suillus clintonianus]|uniref:uncharacterized protein n=1 Tax=Suillus clintonianus TaxID=1904413 RepID=UPI001B884894|nr:uncharacterized protein DEU56DRAFT_855412 [Suillus clintonianus]KAG2141914.1 hypothetical protein DEU56DRAFT_855412 [Suillus clintonianus]